MRNLRTRLNRLEARSFHTSNAEHQEALCYGVVFVAVLNQVIEARDSGGPVPDMGEKLRGCWRGDDVEVYRRIRRFFATLPQETLSVIDKLVMKKAHAAEVAG